MFIPEELEDYIHSHTASEPKYLQELNRKTNLEILSPRMLSGHFQGRLLSMISKMIRPNRILEIGTFTGYSALCLAEGLVPEGMLFTIEVNEELKDIAEFFFEKSGFRTKIKNIIGDAKEIIPQLNEQFDIVFIDADKKNYINYYNIVFDKVRSGGYIIADNVLWSGKVFKQSNKIDPSTQMMIDYNKLIHNDSRVEEILMPIRDGLMIARKI